MSLSCALPLRVYSLVLHFLLFLFPSPFQVPSSVGRSVYPSVPSFIHTKYIFFPTFIYLFDFFRKIIFVISFKNCKTIEPKYDTLIPTILSFSLLLSLSHSFTHTLILVYYLAHLFIELTHLLILPLYSHISFSLFALSGIILSFNANI